MARLNMTDDHDLWLEYRRYGRTWEPVDLWRSRAGRNILAWAAVGASAAAFLTLGGLAGLYAAQPQLDSASRAFADDSVNAIAARWSEGDLLARASPAFDAARSQIFDDSFEQWKGLGPITHSSGCLGGAAIDPLHVTAMITASYACDLDFKADHAVAVLDLDQKQGRWRIDRFYVNADRALPGGDVR